MRLRCLGLRQVVTGVVLVLVADAPLRAQDAEIEAPTRAPDSAEEAAAASEEDVVAAPEEAQRAPCHEGDTDCDGLLDALEQATGTRALQADTDGDGVPDGEEDKSRDGVVDHGESDPRVPGLFPGLYPHIPEPMLFDLVRGLNSKAGEVEVNTLAVLRHRRGHSDIAWAPEVEWAFRDGMAVELELPMDGRELEAIKGAFQASLPSARRDFAHGVQLIGEYVLDGHLGLTTALYIFGGRIGRWSVLSMLGGSALAGTPLRELEHTLDPESRYTLLFNPNVYRDLRENLTLGLESNISLGLGGHHRVRLVPQAHVQLSRRVRVQVGAGAEWEAGHWGLIAASRVVLE